LAVLSKAWFCGFLIAGIAGSNLAEDMDDSLHSVGSGFCHEFITRPEESYRVCV